MDILYRLGRATAGDVMKALPGSPSSSTVRTQLRVLEEKGHVRHEEHGLRYRLRARGAPPCRAKVGAAAPRQHLLRRLSGEGGRGGARRRGRAALGGRTGPHRGSARQSEEGRPIMIKVSLIVLAGLAVARLLRSQSAALRHWVLWAAIACAAVVPAVRTDRAGLERSTPRRLRPRAQLPQPVADGPGPRRQSLAARRRRQEARRRHRPPFASPRRRRLRALADLDDGRRDQLLHVTGRVRQAGVARVTFRAASGTAPGSISRKTSPASYGLRRPVVLLQSDHPTMLVTWGWLRPKVILPAGARDWTRDRMRVVLCHELAHIRRGDWAAQMTAELLRSIYWFNPLMWIASTAPAPRERTGVRRRGVEPRYRWSRIRRAFARSCAGRPRATGEACFQTFRRRPCCARPASRGESVPC